jgi:beta-xylosidase
MISKKKIFEVIAKIKWSSVFFFLLLCSISSFAQRLVLPGDYPDPSVTKIGDRYWATATTSNWAPAYPLLESKDLIHWQTQAHVFPKLPAWADYYFWAPEISYDNGKVYIYYAAHKRDGNLCLAVASADKPEGPYTDHGTLMCEKAGSIDAFPIRDNNGKLYLVWKEDGNSVKQATPIWAMEMNEARTALIGEKKELFRNQEDWESNLVEGVSMIRHGKYFYAFYAGAGCCGRECSYAMGVARAKDLLGPWEKYEKNPLFTSGDVWKCPGHGTAIEKDGQFYLLYHGYFAKGDVYAGRQGLLKEFRFTDDDWIELVDDGTPKPMVPAKLYDEFSGSTLSPQWQWSVFQTPDVAVRDGHLELHAMPDKSGVFLGQRIFTSAYQVDVTLLRAGSNAEAGLAVIGDEKNLVAVTVKGKKISVWQLKNDVAATILTHALPAGDNVYLRVEVTDGKDLVFFYSTDQKNFTRLNKTPIDGYYLPPWDRAVRAAVIAKGPPSAKAVFDDFVLDNR